MLWYFWVFLYNRSTYNGRQHRRTSDLKWVMSRGLGSSGSWCAYDTDRCMDGVNVVDCEAKSVLDNWSVMVPSEAVGGLICRRSEVQLGGTWLKTRCAWVQHKASRYIRTLDVDGGHLSADGARRSAWRWHVDVVDDSCIAQRLGIGAERNAG